jgi:hypothetical protein
MSIPTEFDHKLVAIDGAANRILTHVRTMQHAAAKDIPRMREHLREELKSYVDDVMTAARTK